MNKNNKTAKINIKDRRVVFTSKKGKFIAEFNNLEEAALYLLDKNIASGTKQTVIKNLYGAAQGKLEFGYRFIVLIDDVNGTTKEEIDKIIQQQKEAMLQA